MLKFCFKGGGMCGGGSCRTMVLHPDPPPSWEAGTSICGTSSSSCGTIFLLIISKLGFRDAGCNRLAGCCELTCTDGTESWAWTGAVSRSFGSSRGVELEFGTLGCDFVVKKVRNQGNSSRRTPGIGFGDATSLERAD